MNRAIEGRLRKLEAASPARVTLYVVWGITAEAAAETLAALRASGAVRPREDWLTLVWPDQTPMPASRRIDLREDDIGDRELDLLIRWFEAEAVRMEREEALSAGEDITGLDDIDLYIRHLRRHGQDDELRMLKYRENPDPAEISMASYREWTERVRAWEARYLGPHSPGSQRTAIDRVH